MRFFIFETFKMLAVFVIIFAVLIFIVNYKWKRRRLEKMMKQFRGPPMLPIIGNGFDFLGDPSDALRKADVMWKRYDSPSRIWLLHKPYVMIYSPQDFQIVANSTLEKDDSYKFFVDMLGDGLFTLQVEKWKTHRKLLNAAFNPVFLKDFFMDIFNNQSRILKEKLAMEAETGKHFDLWPYFIERSINTISQTALGCDEDSNSKETIDIFGEALLKSAKLVSKRFYQPWLHPPFIFTLYKKLSGHGNVFNVVHTYPLQVLEAKRKRVHLEKNNDKRNRNFVDILLESYDRDKLTDHELKDEVISILFGGSETNAVTSCFLLLMLGMRQDIQEIAYEEQYKIFRGVDRDVDLRDLSKMYFLEQCIKETLRRFPVAPILLRYASKDIPITNNYIIPTGSNILLSIYAIHHNAKIYPDPLIWNPDNFTRENEASRHKCSFVPFSTGPRECIGKKYAMVALKTQLSHLLRTYRVRTDMKMEDIEMDNDMIIRSKKGYNVVLEYRK